MKNLLPHILGQIETERELQDAEWGGAKHDDKHSVDDWIEQIEKHINLAKDELKDYPKLRRRLIIIAALAVAASESQDRLNYNQFSSENSSFDDWLEQLREVGIIYGLYGAESVIDSELWRDAFARGETPLEALLEDLSNM